MPVKRVLCTSGLVWLTVASGAIAHPAVRLAEAQGWISGLSHPWSGWDHWLAMVTVGLFAVQLGGRALWGLPLGFLSGMVLGFGASGRLVGVSVGAVELAIACSVAILGICVLTGRPSRFTVALALVALCGLFHGHAHGTELPGTAAVVSYFLGMLVSTAILHACGLGLGWSVLRTSAEVWVFRLSGTAVAAAGVFLVVSRW